MINVVISSAVALKKCRTMLQDYPLPIIEIMYKLATASIAILVYWQPQKKMPRFKLGCKNAFREVLHCVHIIL